MPGFETNVATPKRRRRRDDSSASDDFPPASQKKKLQRAAKRQREKSAKQELEAFRQQAKGGGKDYWNKWCVWQQPVKGASKGKNSGLPANTDKMQRTDVDGKTEICRMWNRSTGSAPAWRSAPWDGHTRVSSASRPRTQARRGAAYSRPYRGRLVGGRG